ncbi:c-type cytochrome [Halioglobus pacificus]|uniref:Cytochrome c n=1 Tax=Parahalioglobus pacificus TaxID=930806 RepID=A0A919CIR0_9GAMM|nr:cytochrome c [Halioglobus pacificus]GHD28582.1 cytochrome c [Halioglobus pacificus]
MNHGKKLLVSLASAAAIAISPLALSHFDDKEPMQSYRQSIFALMAMNFGPMGAMLKGEMPWDAEQFKRFAEDLDDVAELDVMRGFAAGTDKGTTRAKPGIWDNMDDFEAKLVDLQTATEALSDAADAGDEAAIKAAFGDTGKACKACHDEYKSKDYLY